MPNRIIKESIRFSDTINQLTWQEEALFYRLLTACDDYGLMDARPSVLRGALCSLRLEEVSDAYVVEWLTKLETVGLIECYLAGGRPYLHVLTWSLHQTIRAQRAKFPAPEAGEIRPACTCMQMYADASKSQHMGANVPVIQSNPIQSESNHVGADAPTPLVGARTGKVFEVDSEPYQLAVYLSRKILANDPEAHVPAEKPGRMAGWAAEMDRLIRLDRRSPETIRAVIDWCQADPFWRSNILSPTALRKQFTRLYLAMQTPRTNGHRPSPGPPRPTPLVSPRVALTPEDEQAREEASDDWATQTGLPRTAAEWTAYNEAKQRGETWTRA